MKDINEYRKYLPDYLKKYHGITNPKKFFRCLNPEHGDEHPSMIYTPKYNICKCFACGVHYDIFSLVKLDFHLSSFQEQIKKVEELFLNYVPEKSEFNQKIIKYDYTNYFNKCIKNIHETNYLLQRGISQELIDKYKIGYDNERQLVIFPINKYCYYARSVNNDLKLKSKGNSDIWNKHYFLNGSKEDLIYVTEGIIDSLSLEMVDNKVKTTSINGVGNINSLIQAIKKSNYKGAIVITFDNDESGIKASKELKEKLSCLGVKSYDCTLSAFVDNAKDINEALVKNKKKLKESFQYINALYKYDNYLRTEKEGEDIVL